MCVEGEEGGEGLAPLPLLYNRRERGGLDCVLLPEYWIIIGKEKIKDKNVHIELHNEDQIYK